MNKASCLPVSVGPTVRVPRGVGGVVVLGLAGLILGSAAGGAFAQSCADTVCGPDCDISSNACCACCSEPIYCDFYFINSSGVASNGMAPASEDESRCWAEWGSDNGAWPLHLNLRGMFGPPEFPPRTLDPVAGSMPLISSVGRHVGSPVPYLETPTQSEIVDLIFGRTLLRAMDFELPFGGAVFRHIRTFGTSLYFHYGAGNRFWDWNGAQWMMGENPIFLIDAQPRWGMMGAYVDMPAPRCYFIPDAHHAIPFIYDANVDRYIAPPWFDALTDYSTNGGEPPTEFHVWLNCQSIKYTFSAYREDYEYYEVDAHTPPPPVGSGGHGWPYYGLLKRIEDRHGNRVEYEYCGLLKFEDDCCDEAPGYDGLCYTCNQQGQIKSIKLYPAGAAENDPAWTLLYYHQAEHPPTHPDECNPWPDPCYETSNEHRLRAIFVYEGDVDLSDFACFTLPLSFICDSTELEAWDDVDYFGAPDDWVYQVEYTHSPDDHACAWYEIPLSVTGDMPGSRLVRVVVRSKGADVDPADVCEERTTLYRYRNDSTSVYPVRIKSIFEPETVDGLLDETGTPFSTNDLLRMDDSADVWVEDPQTGELVERSLGSLATHKFSYHGGGGPCGIQTSLFNYLAAKYATSEGPPACWAGVEEYFANTGDPNVDGRYHCYFLRNRLAEESDDDHVGQEKWAWDGHVPYYYDDTGAIRSYYDPDTNDGDPPIPPFDMARHLAIIDRGKPDVGYDPLDSDQDGEYGMLSRRVVEMNPAGFVLRDRTFNFEDESGTLQSQLGYSEQKVYDEYGRVRQIRTAAWGSDDNLDTQGSDGLIYFFEYGDFDTNGTPDELARTGIMLGTNGTKYYLVDYQHDYPERPELVSRMVRFLNPVTSNGLGSVDLSEHEVTYSSYDLGSNGETLFEEHASHTGQLTEAQDPIYAVRRAQYDDQGRPEYQGFGQATDPDHPATADLLEFFYNYTEYDQYGRKTWEVIDTTSDSIPEKFERVVADEELLPPLGLATSYQYDSQGRPTRIDKSGGRSDYFAYDVTRPDGLLEMWKYADVVSHVTVQPVQIVRYSSQGQLDSTLKVDIGQLNGVYDGSEGYDEADIVSKTTMLYDEYGRPAGTRTLADLSTNGSAVEAKISYDAFGMVGRKLAPDGTITRTVHGMRGRVSKVYRGTEDWHIYWGTAVPCDPYGEPEHCIDLDNPEDVDDNMVLTEKWYYGNGEPLTSTNGLGGKNATGRVVERRRYQWKPTNQYFWEDEEDPFPPNDENEIGLASRYEYDCRMRPVYVEEQSVSGDPLFITLTWYDYQDRGALVADYGSNGVPTGGFSDPHDLDIADELPGAADILSATPAPLALKETLYDLAGRVSEERTYDVGVSDGTQYVSVKYGYEGRGLVIEQQSPNGPTTKSTYDARGRLILQQSFAGGVEVQRVRKVYDALDNLLEDITYERKNGATGGLLETGVAVARYRYYWYDQSNRLIATANYGTNSASDTFESGTPPGYGDAPDYVDDLPNALVTLYGYDDAGRQYRVTDSGDVVTETEYDDMGRVILVTENAEGEPGEPRRHTAYYYEPGTGLLTNVAAVRDEHFAGGPSFAAIDWQATDGTIQVTEYVYGAQVLDANSNGTYSDISTNGGWIRAVHYPDPLTGQPEETPSVTFAYRFDGQVARRIDRRGVKLFYQYDDRDRLASIYADIPADVGSNGVLLDVDTNAALLTYAYTADGLLAEAAIAGAGEQVLNHSAFDYGGYRQLVESIQSLGASEPDRAVAYGWEGLADGVGYRLSTITYPHDETVTFAYGEADGIDDVLSRLVSVEHGERDLADYRYMGLGRLVGRWVGDNVGAHFDDGAGGAVTGLDRYGRVIDLTYTVGVSGPTLVQFQYDHDPRGNRTFARVDDGTDQRSWRYWYDQLSRLTNAAQGKLNAAGTGFEGDVDPESISWFLDDLGNWAGNAAEQDVGLQRFTDQNGDGTFDDGPDTLHAWERQDTNEVNELEALAGGDAAGTNGVQAFAYDAAGNLVFDGERYYVYDAWNRLAAMHQPGTLTVGTNGLEGLPGACSMRFAYDALGRRVLSIEWPDSTMTQRTRHVYGGGAEVLAEYDVGSNGAETLARWFVHGESFPDPLVMVDLSDAGDVAAGVEEHLYYLTDALGSVAALVNDANQVVERYAYTPYGQTEVLDATGQAPDYLPGLASSHYHDHDLDNAIDGADLQHLEDCVGAWASNPAAAPDWRCVFAHDCTGDNVVDLFDYGVFAGFEGFDSNGTPPPTEWERPPTAYFDVDGDRDLDLFDFVGLQACFATTCGLEGCPEFSATVCLFVYDADGDREVDLADFITFQSSLGGPAIPRLAQGTAPASRFGNPFMFTGQRFDPSTGLYHFLARSYDPELGRFLQQDALGVLAAAGEVLLAGLSNAPMVSPPVTCPEDEYLDGLNLYQYVVSNPINLTDPFGLFDYFDEADDITAQIGAERAAAAYHAMRFFEATAHMAATFAFQATLTALVPGAGLLFAGQGLYASVEDILENGLTWGSGASLAANATGVGVSAWRVAGQFRGHMARTRGIYTRGGRLRMGTFSITDWTGYPKGVPRPTGPFRLLTGKEYDIARRATDNANRALRNANPQRYAGKHIHEIHPIKFGGSPTEPANKMALAPPQHSKYTAFWRKWQRRLEK